MKTLNINLLKNYVLLLICSVLLFSCENEIDDQKPSTINYQSISIDKIKKEFNASFNHSVFSNLTAQPFWDNAKTYYDENGSPYIEVPFQILNNEDIKLSTSVSFDNLTVSYSDNKLVLNIIHYFGTDIETNSVDYENVSHKNVYNFNGFITKFDLNKNIKEINRYNTGIRSKNKVTIGKRNEKGDPLFSRDDDPANYVDETSCTRGCWYWEYTDGSREIISCSPWVCDTITYIVPGGFNGSSGGTSYATNENEFVDIVLDTKSFENFLCQKGIILDAISQCSTINSLIANLFETSTSTNLVFVVDSDLRSNGNTSSIAKWNDNTETCDVVISFKQSYLTTGTDLAIARTAIHESVHAVLVQLNEQGKFNDVEGGANPTFTDLAVSYAKHQAAENSNGLGYTHHKYMALMVGDIAGALQSYGVSEGYSLDSDFYTSMAWGGLTHKVTVVNGVPVQTEFDFFTATFPNYTDRMTVVNTYVAETNNDDTLTDGDGNTITTKGTPCN